MLCIKVELNVFNNEEVSCIKRQFPGQKYNVDVPTTEVFNPILEKGGFFRRGIVIGWSENNG